MLHHHAQVGVRKTVEELLKNSRSFTQNVPRVRRSVRSIFREYGPIYARRAYRMDKPAFRNLQRLLEPALTSKHSRKKRIGSSSLLYGTSSSATGATGGDIPVDAKLSIALRYFAGGDPYDIMISHGVSHSAVYLSVWQVVDAVNNCPQLAMKFPEDLSQQKKLAREVSTEERRWFLQLRCCYGRHAHLDEQTVCS